MLLSLAGVTERAGEYEQAEALRARALRIRRTVLGHTHRTAEVSALDFALRLRT